MTTRYRRPIAAVATILALSLIGSGCSGRGGGRGADNGGNPSASAGPSHGSVNVQSIESGFKVGVLLPRSDNPRYQTFDRPLIEAEIKRLCGRCEVLFQVADSDRGKQQTQSESLLAQGAKVLILDPVDATAAAGIVANAGDQGVPVVTYERMAEGPVTYHVSYDPRRLGELQGRTLLEAVTKGGDPKRGEIVMLNAPGSDVDALELKAGAHAALDGKVNMSQVYDTTEPPPGRIQQDLERAIREMTPEKIIGVYAADDATANAAIATMKNLGFPALPPVTGQDADLDAVQRVIAGEQTMTVYKPVRPAATIAAQLAIAAATGAPYQGEHTVNRNNGTKDVPSVLLTPIAVTRTTVNETVLRDGMYTRAAICTPDFAPACTTYLPAG